MLSQHWHSSNSFLLLITKAMWHENRCLKNLCKWTGEQCCACQIAWSDRRQCCIQRSRRKMKNHKRLLCSPSCLLRISEMQRKIWTSSFIVAPILLKSAFVWFCKIIFSHLLWHGSLRWKLTSWLVLEWKKSCRKINTSMMMKQEHFFFISHWLCASACCLQLIKTWCKCWNCQDTLLITSKSMLF